MDEEGTIQSSSNYKFCKELALWTFQQKGVIRAKEMRHNKAGSNWEGVNPENYRIKDDIEFFVELELFSFDPDTQVYGAWEPLKATDVQLKF